MPNAVAISIIIPHFKRHDRLRNALESIARQNYPIRNVQLIVVEDNAEVGTKHAFSDDFPFVEFVKCYARVGAACAKNIGAKRARHQWLVFLDDDVEIRTDWLSAMIEAASNTPQVRCFQSKVLSLENAGIVKSAGGVANRFGYAWDRGVNEPDRAQFDVKKKIMFASSCAMLIRKDLFEAAGGFDNDLFYMGEDQDLGLRLLIRGEEIHYVPRAVCLHAGKCGDEDEVLRQKYYIERNRVFIMLKNYEAAYLAKLLIPLVLLKCLKYLSYLGRFKEQRLRYAGDVVSGWAWIITHAGLIAEKRAFIAAMRKRPVRDILKEFGEYSSHLASVAPEGR